MNSSSSSVKGYVRISAADGYRLWSQSYDTDPNPVVSLEFRRLRPKLADVAGKVFLDVACGTGRWMSAAAKNGARTVGVDLSTDMLQVARGKRLLAGRLIRADAHSLPLADQFADLVMCSFSLAYMRDQERFIRELGRVARPGGRVILSDFHPCTQDMGWRRSFRSGSDIFEIEHHPYSANRLLDFGRCAGLELRELLELRFGDPERDVMRMAGKERLIDEVCSVPAVLGVEWERR